MDYHLNKQVKQIMKNAEQEAMQMGNNYIGSEHLLLALLKEDDSILTKAFKNEGIHYSQIKDDLMILFGLIDHHDDPIQVTQVVEDILERAEKIRKQSLTKTININDLTTALLQSRSCVAIELLHRYGIEEEAVLKLSGIKHQSELDNCPELCNLNMAIRNQNIVGRTREIDFMISILSRKEKANPLLIGEPGVGKTALVEKLASMIGNEEIASLIGFTVYELHLNSLVAGTKYRGDFEEKIQRIIQLLENNPKCIVFIDEIHQMIGAGKSEGSIDVASVLKPYLARGKIKCIGATTIKEYELYLEKDRAIERRFQTIIIKEPNAKATFQMLISKKNEYTSFHQVEISIQMLQKIVDLSDYFIPGRKFPDKAIDVLDLACVSAKKKEVSSINESIIREVIEFMTEIPIASKNRLLEFSKVVKENYIGQNEVVKKIKQQLTWIDNGYLTNRPLATWLISAKAGMGRSTLVGILNQTYFHQDKTINIDITNFDQNLKSAISKIKRNPYGIIHITNLHLASSNILLFLKQSVEKGCIEYQDEFVDLRHSIVILDGDFVGNSPMCVSNSTQTKKMLVIERELGKDFIDIFDDVLIFNYLVKNDKVKLLKKTLKTWDHCMEENALIEAIESSATINEATRKIRKSIVIA